MKFDDVKVGETYRVTRDSPSAAFLKKGEAVKVLSLVYPERADSPFEVKSAEFSTYSSDTWWIHASDMEPIQ